MATAVDLADAQRLLDDPTVPVVTLPTGRHEGGLRLPARPVTIVGYGATIVPQDSPAILAADAVASAGAQVVGLTIDGESRSLNLVQMTSASDVAITDCTLRNSGKAGVLIQSGKSPSTGVAVRDCAIEATGLDDGTTGFGVLVQGDVQGAIIANNVLRKIKGGMGIGGNGIAGTGPRGMVITGNSITMAPSRTGFEAIGLTAQCSGAVIAANSIMNSQDNGISASGHSSTVTSNRISGALNHGIAFEDSRFCVAMGNVIEAIGTEDAREYGYVLLIAPRRCGVMGNIGILGNGHPSHGIKVWRGDRGGNTLGPNQWQGVPTMDGAT